MQTTLNQRIKIFAAFRGLGQKELAEAMEVSLQSASLIANGHSNPKPLRVEKLCNAYPELNKVWLVTGEGEMLNSSKQKPSKAEKSGSYVTTESFELLSKEVQLLRQAVNQLLFKMENFQPSPLQVGKIIELFGEGTCAGDYNLAQVG